MGEKIHDTFVKRMMAFPYVALDVLEDILPLEVIKVMDLPTNTQVKTAFADELLGNKTVDLLYSINFKDKKQTGYIFCLIEHQSTVNRSMTARMRVYMEHIWLDHKKKHPKKPLPPIFPLIFYTGKENYTAPREFWELFEDPKLAKKWANAPVKIISLKDMKNIDLKKRTYGRMMMLVMKRIRDNNIVDFLTEFMSSLQEIGQKKFDLLKEISYYILKGGKAKTKDEVLDCLARTVPENKKEEIMYIVNQITKEGREQGREEGRKEGIEQGREQGMQKVAKNLLSQGVSLSIIASSTGLSESDIRRLSVYS